MIFNIPEHFLPEFNSYSKKLQIVICFLAMAEMIFLKRNRNEISHLPAPCLLLSRLREPDNTGCYSLGQMHLAGQYLVRHACSAAGCSRRFMSVYLFAIILAGLGVVAVGCTRQSTTSTWPGGMLWESRQTLSSADASANRMDARADVIILACARYIWGCP